MTSVDRDISADVSAGGWKGIAAGTAHLRIDDANQQRDTEDKILTDTGTDSTHVAITVGLGAQKEIGAWVFLCWRNIIPIRNGTSGLFGASFSIAR